MTAKELAEAILALPEEQQNLKVVYDYDGGYFEFMTMVVEETAIPGLKVLVLDGEFLSSDSL